MISRMMNCQIMPAKKCSVPQMDCWRFLCTYFHEGSKSWRKIVSCGILPPPPYHLRVSLVALFSARRTVGHHNRGISSINNRATITLYPTYFPSVSLMHGFRSICLAFYRCFYFYFFWSFPRAYPIGSPISCGCPFVALWFFIYYFLAQLCLYF